MSQQPKHIYIVRRTDTNEYDTGEESADGTWGWSSDFNRAFTWSREDSVARIQSQCEEAGIPIEVIDLLERYGVLL